MRVMAQCMAIGQAIGTAAALALKEKIEPAKIDVSQLQEELKKDDALLVQDENDIIHDEFYGF
ncbi:MAG: FAD-dependent oxidoreductase [Lachnospiraceae bacterium]